MSVKKVITTPDKTLRLKSRHIKVQEIKTEKIQKLVSDIYETIKSGEYGVGMSAIQIGKPLAISVVMIRPTPTRPDLENFSKVYFNPLITKAYGKKEPMWEGCCSVLDDNASPLFAKVPRYRKICVEYRDESGKKHEDIAEDFLAHVLQHEIDHINGILFTDLVSGIDIVTLKEYQKALKTKK